MPGSSVGVPAGFPIERPAFEAARGRSAGSPAGHNGSVRATPTPCRRLSRHSPARTINGTGSADITGQLSEPRTAAQTPFRRSIVRTTLRGRESVTERRVSHGREYCRVRVIRPSAVTPRRTGRTAAGPQRKPFAGLSSTKRRKVAGNGVRERGSRSGHSEIVSDLVGRTAENYENRENRRETERTSNTSDSEVLPTETGTAEGSGGTASSWGHRDCASPWSDTGYPVRVERGGVERPLWVRRDLDATVC